MLLNQLKFISDTIYSYIPVLGLKAVRIYCKSRASWVLYVLPILNITVQILLVNTFIAQVNMNKKFGTSKAVHKEFS